MNDLYEALEICLQDIEQGADLESVLFRYPELADELRPMLETAADAKSMSVPAPSADVVRRNRARILQHAAQLREANVKPSRRNWLVPLRRIAVTLAVVAVLFISGTGLVGASSNTLPGDNLYPVKRTWEDLRLFFTFNQQEREALEVEHENERLYELNELFAEGRSAEVDFKGRVTSQTGNGWVVAGVRVLISSQTDIHEQIAVGSAVRVRGLTQGDGTVLAERVQLLSAGAKLPDVESEQELEGSNENNSGSGSVEKGPKIEKTETPETENENSGSSSVSNENHNENENSNLNENDKSNENNSGSENSGSNDNGNENDNSGKGGGNNENGSGGEDNSGSGGGGGEKD